jgi:hypothetical protein
VRTRVEVLPEVESCQLVSTRRHWHDAALPVPPLDGCSVTTVSFCLLERGMP